METNMIDVNTEVAKLHEEKKSMEEDMKLKNDLNDLLIEEKNKLEEKVVSNLATMQKMFKERNVMKEMIDKQKNDLKNAGNIVPNTSDENDLAKKLAEKI